MAAPSKKPSSKGAPPKPSETHVVGNNTTKPAAGEKVPLNFRVDPEFKRRLKGFAVAHDVDMVDVMMDAVGEYLDKKGG